MKKILFLRHTPLEQPWYVENHIEYIMRYLGDKYLFDLSVGDEIDYVTNFPENYKAGFFKDPNKYDLLVPLLTGFTHLENPKKFYHKMAGIVWEPGEVTDIEGICYASTNEITDKQLDAVGYPYVKTRPGIDTELFRPVKFAREDDLLHVGFVGKCHSQRKQVKDLLMPLADLERVRLMFYSQQPLPEKEIDYCGGKEFLKRLEGGNKSWIGMPNVYNQLDVLIETDADLSVSFPTLEAAACGIPVICTKGGMSGPLVRAGAAIEILPDDKTKDPRDWAYNETADMAKKIKEAVVYLRDNPERRKKMGKIGREEIIMNWQWCDVIDKWEDFFNKSLSLAR